MDAYNSTNDLIRRVNQRVDAATRAYVNISKFYYSNFQSFVLATRPTSLTAQIGLYPSPTTGTATLQINGLRQLGGVSISVLNRLVQSVLQLSSPAQQGTLTFPLNMGKLPAGLYTVQVRTAEGTATQRLVKQ